MYQHEYLRDAILIITIFLFIGVSAGYTGVSFFSGLSDTIGEMYAGLDISDDPTQSPLQFAFSVFYNNIQSCAIAFLGGIVFSLIPIGLILYNGFFLGASIKILSHQGSFFFLSIIPNVLFEIPALILSASLGMMLGQKYVYNKILHRTCEPIDLKELVRIFILYVIPMMFIAAVLEAYVSTHLLEILGS